MRNAKRDRHVIGILTGARKDLLPMSNWDRIKAELRCKKILEQEISKAMDIILAKEIKVLKDILDDGQGG